MKNLKFILALLLISVGCQSALSQMVYRGTVVEIVDGRTVVVELRERHRLTVELQHIEVPEPGQELHQTVKEHLGKLLLGKPVEYRANRLERTKTVGQVVTADGVDISLQMLRDGAAWYAPVAAGEQQRQHADESYRGVEAQAKLEKRGVWSIPNLKTAWEFRAERAAEISRQAVLQNEAAPAVRTPETSQQEYATAAARREASPPAAGRRQTSQRRPAGAPDVNVEMWANVDDYSKLKESVYSSGLLTSYNPYVDWGYLSTPDADFDTPAGGKINRAIYRVGYFYKGSHFAPGHEAFVFLFQAESKKWAFAESNNLTIVAGGRAMNLGKAYRITRQSGPAAEEFLLYRISRAALARVAAAKKVEMKIGAYSSPFGAKQQKMVRALLADTE